MNIYHLTRKTLWDYDEYDSFVVLASNELQARLLAEEAGGRGNGMLWLDSDQVDCEEINLLTEEAQVLLGSFNAG